MSCFDDDSEKYSSSNHSSSFNLQNFPQIVIEQIMSYFAWNQKIKVVAAIPQWRTGLYSSQAWPSFHITIEMRKREESPGGDDFHDCITEYGKYFKHLSIVLVTFDFKDTNIALLELISENCLNLKSLRVDHPSPLLQFYIVDILYKYARTLHNIVERNGNMKSVALCDINYMPFDRYQGANELLSKFVPCRKLMGCITMLELCDFYDFSDPYESLDSFINLRILKVHIEVLSTNIILSMCRLSLEELHIVNSGSALNETFIESEQINWSRIYDHAPHLKVYYIYQARSLRVEDIVQNKLVHSLTIDSLCNSVENEIILTLISKQGYNLRSFAHLDTFWNFNAYEEDFDYVGCYTFMAQSCEHLEVVVISVAMSCLALMEMVEFRKFKKMVVVDQQLFIDFDYCCNDDLNMDYFHRFMKSELGPAWQCLPEKNLTSIFQNFYKL